MGLVARAWTARWHPVGSLVAVFAGDFETHLTVAAGAHERLCGWAERRGLKFTRIQLEAGAGADQPMVTARGRGSLDAQRAAAAALVRDLGADGFTVVRVKIEASPFNADVPQSATEAASLPPGCYFEHHVKLLLAGDADVAQAREASHQHGGRLSRNARRNRADGRQERFVTQRCYGVGRPEARQRLDALLSAVTAAGYPAIEVEEEFVVVDDNPALDHGWIDG
jgi:hypothetical protein